MERFLFSWGKSQVEGKKTENEEVKGRKEGVEANFYSSGCVAKFIQPNDVFLSPSSSL